MAINLLKPTVVADAKCVAARLEQVVGKPVDATVINGIDTTRFHQTDKMSARRKLNLPPNGQ